MDDGGGTTWLGGSLAVAVLFVKYVHMYVYLVRSTVARWWWRYILVSDTNYIPLYFCAAIRKLSARVFHIFPCNAERDRYFLKVSNEI